MKGFAYSSPLGRPLCELCFLRNENERLQRSSKIDRQLYESMKKERDSIQRGMESEREGLVSWLRSRIAQQQQTFKMPYISKDSKRLIEVEIGFIERYLAIILDGKHRNNRPTVSVPEGTEFKTLRDMEKDDVLAHLAHVASKEETAAHRHALLTVSEQIQGDEHRTI